MVTTLLASVAVLLPPAPVSVAEAAKAVGDWQLAHPSRHRTTDWTQAPFLVGLIRASDLPGCAHFLEAAQKVCGKNQWKPGPRPLMADDHAVAQAYVELSLRKEDPAMLGPWKQSAGRILNEYRNEPLLWGNGIENREWAWCDALFMAPPALAGLSLATGDPAPLEAMKGRWWKTTDYLYDKTERLFYRDSRYFTSREKNGRKVFWSRGNGWVIAGLARVLTYLPANDPDRPKFVRLFHEMADRLRTIQPQDGYWRASLLDPASYPNPETSGTGFICYALAWGLNEKLLPNTYRPTVDKAWAALQRAVGPDGKLGWVQPIGADPRQTKAEDTEVYGVGAFLLAASEVYRLTAQ